MSIDDILNALRGELALVNRAIANLETLAQGRQSAPIRPLGADARDGVRNAAPVSQPAGA